MISKHLTILALAVTMTASGAVISPTLVKAHGAADDNTATQPVNSAAFRKFIDNTRARALKKGVSTQLYNRDRKSVV